MRSRLYQILHTGMFVPMVILIACSSNEPSARRPELLSQIAGIAADQLAELVAGLKSAQAAGVSGAAQRAHLQRAQVEQSAIEAAAGDANAIINKYSGSTRRNRCLTEKASLMEELVEFGVETADIIHTMDLTGWGNDRVKRAWPARIKLQMFERACQLM